MSALPVVVTGAHGFIGHALCLHFAAVGRPFRAIVRSGAPRRPWAVPPLVLGDLASVPDQDLEAALAGAHAVVHLAARAHVMDERSADRLAAYHSANVRVTERLLAAARRSGVQRFVLASTVKVCGETSPARRPFTPATPMRPRDAYARSKAAAERLVLSGAGRLPAGLVLRFPLVYGPRVRGNFCRLLEAVASERVLPLGAVHNARSLAYVGNLVEAIEAALSLPEPIAGTHFLADANSVSTSTLVTAMGAALGTPARLLPVPVSLLRLAAALTGRGTAVARLVGNLEVDTSSFRQASGWRPRYALEEGLAATAAWWRTRHAL